MSAALIKLLTVMGLVGFSDCEILVSSLFEHENKSNKTKNRSNCSAIFIVLLV